MLVFLQKPEEQYFELIEAAGPSVIVFGEVSEHWTAQMVQFLERNNPSIFFLPWSKVPNLRVQLGMVKYPVVQLWRDKNQIAETVGYHEESLDGLVRKFFQSKK